VKPSGVHSPSTAPTSAAPTRTRPRLSKNPAPSANPSRPPTLTSAPVCAASANRATENPGPSHAKSSIPMRSNAMRAPPRPTRALVAAPVRSASMTSPRSPPRCTRPAASTASNRSPKPGHSSVTSPRASVMPSKRTSGGTPLGSAGSGPGSLNAPFRLNAPASSQPSRTSKSVARVCSK
jgi:hypothetical protein